jgi:hypothetical protein
MALPSSPATASTHHPPRISISISSCCCPSSPCPLQIQITSRRTPPAAYLLRVATASSTASSTRSRGRGHLPPPAALPDPQAAAALLLAAAGTVGAASLLLRSSSSSAASQQQRQEEQEQVEGEECPDCGGTGLCGRCKGEGFVFKQLSEETATKARKAAKNMATRYTAGYCTSSHSSFNSSYSCIPIYMIYPSSPVTKQEHDHDACDCDALQAADQVDLLQQVLLHPLLHNLPRLRQNHHHTCHLASNQGYLWNLQLAICINSLKIGGTNI